MGLVTFSNFKMLAVKFSGIFESGLIFSMVVFFGFIRTEPFVMVNGLSVDVRDFLFSVISASVFVTSNEPCRIGTFSISISASIMSAFDFGFNVVVDLIGGLLIKVDDGPLRVLSSNIIDDGVVT